MGDMICKIDPAFQAKVVEMRCGQKLLYGQIKKAVYGTLLRAIIFHQKLSNQLTDWGFEMNPYDKCTFNKMVNGEQLTIQFYVDDLKASHKDPAILENLKKEL